MAQTPEGKVKDKIKQWLDEQGAFSFMPVPSGYGSNGQHDFTICIPKVVTQDMIGKTIGMYVSIEAKAEGGKMTKLQEERATEITAAFGIVECVAGTGEAFDRAIESLEDQL